MAMIANAKSDASIDTTISKSAVAQQFMHTDVLIIGAGLAGFSTALALPKSLSITLLSKAALEVCSSHYAQGGIAASLDKTDSVHSHVADTLVAGAGLCAADSTTSILSQGQQAIQWLHEQGVPFTRNTSTLHPNLHNKESFDTVFNTVFDTIIADLHLTQEGGHGCRRVAHADDATGRHVMEALTVKAQSASNITILACHEALELLTSETSDSQSIDASNAAYCQGAVVYDHNSHSQITIYSRAVVMASGGLGQLFQRASAPNVCVGDGVMMAWQAGCRLANLEFVQFHPTGLALNDSNFLISEALRGEGGHLFCPKTNQRFMLAVDPRAELAPRDIVARAIASQIEHNGLGYVHLDVSHLPAKFLHAHFPQIYQTLLGLGIDITTSPIPVAPTAHYSCGGIVTCTQGLSDVKGLYAAGEVAYTGLHGANRLASNSLLECVVVGRNIAAHLPQYLSDHRWTTPSLANAQIISLAESEFLSRPSPHKQIAINTNLNDNIKGAQLKKDAVPQTLLHDTASQLKALMTSHMGIVRNAKQLQQALIQLQSWQQAVDILSKNTSAYLSSLDAIDRLSPTENLDQFRLSRQLQLATLVVQSALQRHESRGGHYRTDYPNLLSKPLVSLIEPQYVNDKDSKGFKEELDNLSSFNKIHIDNRLSLLSNSV